VRLPRSSKGVAQPGERVTQRNERRRRSSSGVCQSARAEDGVEGTSRRVSPL
jgi:hypothetical protein